MTGTETFGRTIQLFLVDGTPNGLRKATIYGWTGLIFVATGTTLVALTARPKPDRNSNGRTEWKVKGSKQSHHDWQQAPITSEGVGV